MKSKLLNILLFTGLIALVAAAAVFQLQKKPIDFKAYIPSWTRGEWLNAAVGAVLLLLGLYYGIGRKRRR